MAFKPILKACWNALTDARWRYYYIQRRTKNRKVRETKARKMAARLPQLGNPPGAEADQLNRDGILPLPALLGAQEISEMRAYFAPQLSVDPYRPELGEFVAPAEAPSQTHVAYFSNETVVHAPHALEVANHPAILGPVATVLGAKPTISYMAAWWSLPKRGNAEHAELYHRDYDDLRFVKLFLYLTDVDAGSGPHCFVRGSHRDDRLIARKRFTDAAVAEAFPREDQLRLEGPAGTAFLENTFGLHRGIPPAERPRLIFQVLYSLQPYIAGPPRPLRTVASGDGQAFDPYINRVYMALR